MEQRPLPLTNHTTKKPLFSDNKPVTHTAMYALTKERKAKIDRAINQINTENVLARISPYGDIGKGLRTSKPTGEAPEVRYVWQFANYEMREDRSCLASADYNLAQFIENATGVEGCYIGELRNYTSASLEKVVEKVLRAYRVTSSNRSGPGHVFSNGVA